MTPFHRLDEFDAALLLAKALHSPLQSGPRWVEMAHALAAAGQRGAKIPQLRGEKAARRIGRLARMGLVEQRPSWGRSIYGMSVVRAHEVLRAAQDEGRLEPAIAVAWGRADSVHSSGAWPGWSTTLARARALLVAGDLEGAMRRARDAGGYTAGANEVIEGDLSWTVQLFGATPPDAWLDAASDELLVSYARGLGEWTCVSLGPMRGATLASLDRQALARKLTPARRYPVELLRGAILSQSLETSRPLVEVRGKSMKGKLGVLHAFVQGDLERAFALGCETLERAKARPAPAGFGRLEGFAFLLSCIDAGRRAVPGAWTRFADALEYDTSRQWKAHADVHLLLDHLHGMETGVESSEVLEDLIAHRVSSSAPWPVLLVAGLLTRWFDGRVGETLAEGLKRVASAAKEHLLPTTLPNTLALLGEDAEAPAGIRSFLGIYAPRPIWMHVVEQFEELADRVAPSGPAGVERGFQPHVVWQIGSRGPGEIWVEPRLITSPRSSVGRAIRVQELLGKHGDTADRHDVNAAQLVERAVDAIEYEHGYVGAHPQGTLMVNRATLLGLVGHPRVRDEEGRPVKIVRGEPRVVVEGDAEGARVFVEPEELRAFPVACVRESTDRVGVYESDDRIEQVFRALAGAPGGRIPLDALARLKPALTRLAGHLPLEGRGTVDLEGKPVEPRSTIDVDLEWRDPTLTIELGVRPLGTHGLRCLPGEGQLDLVADVDGVLSSTRRDLDEERRLLAAALDSCPGLAALEVDEQGARFAHGLEDSCRLLEELTRAAGEGALSLGWPRGKPLRLSREYDAQDFNIRIRRGRPNWLAVDAHLRVDEGEVLAWRVLSAHRSGSGRYVRLDDDRVIKLSESLRRKLAAIERMAGERAVSRGRDVTDGPESSDVVVPDHVLPALAELLGDGESVEMAQDVAARREQIEAALEARPRPPKALEAKLRAYQREGFQWMSRLAMAGFGAVLADDMGLGKTVQTLALLLERKDDGPALVVCPTSVTVNWCQEAQRFAPDLTLVRIGELPMDQRLPTLEALGPGEVGVMSYGLLSRMEEALEGLYVSTLVFDEAHALKNARTNRTQAATAIEADFRLGLTGTPIENHLGELWSVMNVCIPGLLGDEEYFSRGLANAIEEGNEDAMAYLRALIRPFLLRRTKEKVLHELPERTENVVTVEPGRQERAWYEAQRRLAQDKIEAASKDRKLGKGQARILMLTEIGRLRRAAVDPRLVDDRAPKGAKLDLVVDRAKELVSAGHQVLIFTQFLDVIRMLDGRLRKKGVRTLILQGSTSANERARRIEQFQAGEAGGVGVNLTAADYVLHVDPWWNPAVEDQATGRAHRMGQTRPVTVYRFCTSGTIEPRILDLHDRKRELAEDLLTGMNKSKRLDLEELRALMGG